MKVMASHPRGVPVLVSLKAWELFSYQGMRAFLVFYLMGAFSLSDAHASVIFGAYAALVLALSVLGGVLADRWLGPREPMTAGALLIMAGHLCLALESLLAAQQSLSPAMLFQVFCGGLACISVGTGLLKPNVLNLLGGLYRSDDPLRERGFYAYYIGVNIGSFAAPLVCGYLGANFGWGWGFAAAAFGMATGLLVLLWGRRHLDGAMALQAPVTWFRRGLIYSGIVVMVGVSSYLIQHGVALGLLLVVGIVSSAVYFLWRARAQVAGRAGQMLARLLALMAIPLTYSVLFEQFSLSINLFIDRLVDRKIGVFTVAAPQLLSLNAFFVLLFLPLLGAGWAALERRGREPATSQKFALGFAFIAAGFWLLSSTSGMTSQMTGGLADAVEKVPMLYVVLAYLLITLGELCIAPLSYATVGRIVPMGLQGLAMGMLLLAFALGNLGASWLATAAAIPDGMLAAASGEVYRHFFMVPAAIALVAVPVCLAASRLLDRTVPT